MIWYSRWERLDVEWFDYLIDDEIIWVDISDLSTSFTTCTFERFLQNNRSDLKEKILIEERCDEIDERHRQERFENDEIDNYNQAVVD